MIVYKQIWAIYLHIRGGVGGWGKALHILNT
jgi:hypothetical protein